MRKGRLPSGLRRARMGDVEAMTDLLSQLFGIESDFAVKPEKQRAGLRALLRRRDCHVLVAIENGEVAGMATLQRLVSTAEGGPVGIVEDLIVRGQSRGKGLGSRLLAGLEDIAQREGLLRLQLLADRRNAPAEAFYRAHSWSMTNMGAWKKLLSSC